MRRGVYLVFLIMLAVLLCQCSTAPDKGMVSAPIVLPGTNEPTAFCLKGVSGLSRPSQVMGAMERVMDVSKRDMDSKKHPLVLIGLKYSAKSNATFAIFTKSFDSERTNGRSVTVVLPMIAFSAPDVPQADLVKTAPEIQRYALRIMSTEFTPIRPDELKKVDSANGSSRE